MNSQQIAYVNGEFLPESEAKISINDRGFIYGDAVFDTARTFNGKIFFLDDIFFFSDEDIFFFKMRYFF